MTTDVTTQEAANDAATSVVDRICIFVSENRSAKIVTPFGVEAAENSTSHNAQEGRLRGLDDLYRTLQRISENTHVFVVRGGLIKGPGLQVGIRRLLLPKADCPATVNDCARWWLALDIDGAPLPDAVDRKDIAACARETIKVLPLEFEGVRCIVQASSSHGLKPGARLRLWFWLSRPLLTAEVKVWLADARDEVDKNLFCPSQPIFTAKPLFQGCEDHLPCRLAMIEGADCVKVPPIVVPPRVQRMGQPGSDATLEDIEAALGAIPNKDLAWEVWSRVGMAAHAASGGSENGFEAFCRWSSKSAKHDRGTCLERWEHWHGSPAQDLTFGTLAHLARQADPNWQPPSGPQSRLDAAQSEFEAFGGLQPSKSLDDESCSPEFSDDALATEFAKTHRGQLYHVSALGRWFYFDGSRYCEDNQLRHMDLARGVCRQVSARAAKVTGDALPRRLASAQAVAATAKLAASDPIFARGVEDFDSDPWALNTPAGVLDLRSGRLRDRRASDLFTKVAGAAPGGCCPRWRSFLEQITQGDSGLVDYLQRFIGYTLTGITTEQVFIFAYGPGGNGKGVLMSTIAAMMGDYATTAMQDVFTASHNEQHPTNLAALRGARMVAVTETEEGRPWAESRVKAITGGDKISARVMRGDPFEFTPVCKLWFAGNFKPALRNPDPAMRRRMNLVPLSHRPERPDTGLAEALRAELGGILAWAVEGCLRWQAEGLQPPAIVTQETDNYFADQDHLADWMAERCKPDPAAKTPSGDLYASWAAWACGRGLPPRGDKWFSPALERHYVKTRTKGGMVFSGIGLLPEVHGFGLSGVV